MTKTQRYGLSWWAKVHPLIGTTPKKGDALEFVDIHLVPLRILASLEKFWLEPIGFNCVDVVFHVGLTHAHAKHDFLKSTLVENLGPRTFNRHITH